MMSKSLVCCGILFLNGTTVEPALIKPAPFSGLTKYFSNSLESPSICTNSSRSLLACFKRIINSLLAIMRLPLASKRRVSTFWVMPVGIAPYLRTRLQSLKKKSEAYLSNKRSYISSKYIQVFFPSFWFFTTLFQIWSKITMRAICFNSSPNFLTL